MVKLAPTVVAAKIVVTNVIKVAMHSRLWEIKATAGPSLAATWLFLLPRAVTLGCRLGAWSAPVGLTSLLADGLTDGLAARLTDGLPGLLTGGFTDRPADGFADGLTVVIGLADSGRPGLVVASLLSSDAVGEGRGLVAAHFSLNVDGVDNSNCDGESFHGFIDQVC